MVFLLIYLLIVREYLLLAHFLNLSSNIFLYLIDMETYPSNPLFCFGIKIAFDLITYFGKSQILIFKILYRIELQNHIKC